MLFALLMFAQETKPPDGPPIWSGAMPIVAMVVIGYFLLLRPTMQREKKQREMIANNLKKNVEVVTSGGIIGIVHTIKDNSDEVTLKIDDGNAKIRVLKSSIVRITSPETTPPA